MDSLKGLYGKQRMPSNPRVSTQNTLTINLNTQPYTKPQTNYLTAFIGLFFEKEYDATIPEYLRSKDE